MFFSSEWRLFSSCVMYIKLGLRSVKVIREYKYFPDSMNQHQLPGLVSKHVVFCTCFCPITEVRFVFALDSFCHVIPGHFPVCLFRVISQCSSKQHTDAVNCWRLFWSIIMNNIPWIIKCVMRNPVKIMTETTLGKCSSHIWLCLWCIAVTSSLTLTVYHTTEHCHTQSLL